MKWFGFGFNSFGQILLNEKVKKGEFSDAVQEEKVIGPVELASCGRNIDKIRATWSRRASLHLDGDGCLCLAGLGAASESCRTVNLLSGCRDASISESHLTLAFTDRIEVWDLQKEARTLSWSMQIQTESPGPPLNLPLVSGGYIDTKHPFYCSLSPHLRAKSLTLSAGHAILLTASGAVYTWGMGSHGQLGHGDLTSEEEPRAVEALWGMPMICVATGGWHSVCISDGGDLYVWGWNERGQLGLPSQGLRKEQQQQQQHSSQAGPPCINASTCPAEGLRDRENHEEVFISIQAFPALLDIAPSCEISTVSCGSRHTAAVTTKGDLYTWGWGDYGQLGHPTLVSTDEPQRVEFFREQQMCVVDVVCGAWNTFAAVINKEVE